VRRSLPGNPGKFILLHPRVAIRLQRIKRGASVKAAGLAETYLRSKTGQNLKSREPEQAPPNERTWFAEVALGMVRPDSSGQEVSKG
jgi:hypothetical protein